MNNPVEVFQYTYLITQYEDITVASKTSEENMLLSVDEEGLEEFIYSDSLDQLLNYVASKNWIILTKCLY